MWEEKSAASVLDYLVIQVSGYGVPLGTIDNEAIFSQMKTDTQMIGVGEGDVVASILGILLIQVEQRDRDPSVVQKKRSLNINPQSQNTTLCSEARCPTCADDIHAFLLFCSFPLQFSSKKPTLPAFKPKSFTLPMVTPLLYRPQC